MLNPVRKAGKFVKKNRVPITAFVIGAGIVVIYVFSRKDSIFLSSKNEYQMSENMGMLWNEFLKEYKLYDAWDKHLYTYR